MASLSVLHILRTIKERGSISRTELQQITGLSWGTITNTTRELLTRNLILEEGTLPTKAGRKPMRLAINPGPHALIGVDIAPHRLRAIALNLSGEPLFFQEKEYTIALAPERVLDLVADLIRAAQAEPAVARRTLLGVGVAAPGALDVVTGTLRHAPRLPAWNNVPIRDYLESKIGHTVLLEHDPNCLALAERWFGEASAAEDVLCILLSDGIGMGILLNGEIFRGSQQLAGEFGHITVDPNGPACACGDYGCIEAFCSISAVIDAARHNTTGQSAFLRGIFATRLPTLGELIEAARQNDPAAREAFHHMGRYLGLGAANLVDLLNPALIVLAGPLTAASDFFMESLNSSLSAHAWRHSTRHVIISRLGPRAIAIGACGRVLQSLFEAQANGNATAKNGHALPQEAHA